MLSLQMMLLYHPCLIKLTVILLLATLLLISLFATSIVTYDENTPPLEGDVSKSTQDLYCTWCNTYVKHGQEWHTRSALDKHQKGSKCRLQLIGAL